LRKSANGGGAGFAGRPTATATTGDYFGDSSLERSGTESSRNLKMAKSGITPMLNVFHCWMKNAIRHTIQFCAVPAELGQEYRQQRSV
jgi:hypothetical protein